MFQARAAVVLAIVCLGGGLAGAQDSPPTPTAPDAPEPPALIGEATAVLVSFQRAEGVASYRVERAVGEEGEFAEVATVTVDPKKDALSHRDTGLEAGGTYRYRLVAINAAGASEPSEPAQLSLLRAPSGVTVEPKGQALEVRWKDEDPEETKRFTIERRSLHEGGGKWVVADPPRRGAARVVGSRRKSRKERGAGTLEFDFQDESADADVLYEYRVVAQGRDGSAASASVRAAPRRAPRPPQLRAGAYTIDRISLQWQRGSRDAERYRVERRAPGAETWEPLAEAEPWVSSHADAVSPGQAFEYRVVALNAKGEAASNAVGARTPTRGPKALGVTGGSGVHQGPTAVPDTRKGGPQHLREHFSPLPDRWRIQFPEWNRYPEKIVDPEEAPYDEGHPLNPYTQNVIKGDYPIFGNDIFFVFEAQSDTLVEGRSFPFPSGVSTRDSRGEDFFGSFDQFFFNQNFVLSAEIFQGDAAFRPKDAAFKVTGVGNVNYLQAYENNLVNIDVREGDDRLDGHFGIQELLIDKHIVDLGPNYDFITLIGGIQRFQSDFRGFMFADNNLGVRLQTNYLSNRLQLNLAWFHQLEKESNSGLNRYEFRDQNVFVANLYVQDVFKEVGKAVFGHEVLGYTLLFNYHYNWDDGGRHFDSNDFQVRPAKIGQNSGAIGGVRDNEVEVHYLGFGGDGHIGPINLSHQYYMAIGKTSFNEIAGQEQDVLAHFFAIEASIDVDWLRFKASYLYASGDPNPSNGTGSGFSAIFDNPFFAGSGFSYFNRQNIPLVQTGVQLTNRLSLLPDLRSSKIEGSSSFVNPGLHLFNVGASARLTQKLFVDLNVNFLYFDTTETLQFVLVQNDIDRSIGVDYNVGIQYRPFLTDNVIITAGGSALVPGEGFRQIYSSKTLYSGFVALTLTY